MYIQDFIGERSIWLTFAVSLVAVCVLVFVGWGGQCLPFFLRTL